MVMITVINIISGIVKPFPYYSHAAVSEVRNQYSKEI
jgi:hypothetical protein